MLWGVYNRVFMAFSSPFRFCLQYFRKLKEYCLVLSINMIKNTRCFFFGNICLIATFPQQHLLSFKLIRFRAAILIFLIPIGFKQVHHLNWSACASCKALNASFVNETASFLSLAFWSFCSLCFTFKTIFTCQHILLHGQMLKEVFWDFYLAKIALHV